MTVVVWLTLLSAAGVGLFGLFIWAGADDARAARHPLPHVIQPRRLEPSWERVDRDHARAHGSGRHRRLEEGPPL